VVSGPLDGPQLLDLLEELGVSLSGLESCSSPSRGLALSSISPEELTDMAASLLSQAVCPRRPAGERLAYLRTQLAASQPAALLYARQSFCDPAAYDALGVARLARELALPFLEVEVGLPLEISGPLRTRLEAFLETLLLDL
jgi:benzoyl-CoA reductase/2-hydroxyglutaryl-CoA dehydratase subunit BcrC/BadD/HgdB